ncbi:GntR family transcriptional regulator (plasmid) [Actinoplanes sp. CA-030573]|uniref:GntR family transcriptional regulator n=1 Tax=Actinoplanes sp. CA-030573 TaxID=3239898 RepID=UPI003D8FE245
MAGSRPRWEIVYDDLRREIDQEKLCPGDRVPTELDLAARYGFSRATIRTAITRLEQDGLITGGAGSLGRHVRRRELISWNLTKFELGAYVDDPVNFVDQWEADAHSEGWNTRQVVAGVAELAAPDQVALYLGCKPGTRLIRRRRLRYISKPEVPEQLAMIADTWTPVDIARLEIDGVAPLMEESSVVYPGGIYRALGFRQVRYEDDIQARMPTPEEADLLAVQPGTPVGQHARVGVDASGRRVRVLISVFAGDRQRLRYTLDVPSQRPAADKIPEA